MTADRPAGKVPLDALLAHRDWVRALARRLVLDENDADDVEQETWRMAVEKPPRHAESLRSWLATVVRNAARMSGRRRSRRASHEAEAAVRRDVPSPADLVAAAELQTRLARAVLELDEPYRSTVLYRFREGLETLEIAARLGVPLETVRTRLKRAVAQLRERMGADLGDDRDAWCLMLIGMRAADVRPLAPVGTGAAAAALGGGVAMAVGTKLAVGVAAALIAAIAWWSLDPDGDAGGRVVPPRPAGAPDVVTPAPPGNPVRTRSDAAETLPAASPALRLRGLVIDAEDRPAPGVRVVFLPEKLADGRPVQLTDAATPHESVTGADGHFDAEPGSGSEVVSAFALCTDGSSGFAAAVRPGEDATIRLVPAATISGRVTDVAGNPIDGARVCVGGLADAASYVRTARCGPDGGYRVDRIAVPAAAASRVAALVQVEFSATGFAPLLVPMSACLPSLRPGEERRISPSLARGVTIVGSVVEAGNGAPAGDVELALVSEEGRQGVARARGGSVENPFAPRTLATTKSAVDGSFRFEHVPVRSPFETQTRLGVVRASKAGFAVSEADVAAANDGASVDVRVTLRRATTIAGRVVDRAGRPVGGLGIWAQVGDERNTVSARTDAEGRYRLEGFPASAAGETVAVVHAWRTYEDRDQYAAQNSRVEVRIGEGGDRAAPDLVWNYPDWPVVRFVVVGESGLPVRDAVVESAGDAIAILRCDDEGRGERAVRPYPPEFKGPPSSVRWIVRAPGHAAAAVWVPSAPSDGQELRVVLRPGRHVKGRVVGADGAPRVGVLVRALDPAIPLDVVFDAQQRTSMDSLARRWPNVPFLGTGRTDGNGDFDLADLPDGLCTIGAWSGRAGEWAAATDVRGGSSDVVIRLTDPSAAAAAIGARAVLDVQVEDGAPRIGCRALATGPGGAIWSEADPGKPGSTVFALLPAGTWTLSIDIDGFVPWTLRGFVVEKGRAPDAVPVSLRRGATVAGRVTLPEGKATGGLCVLLVSQSGGVATAPLDADGAFRRTGMTPGRWRVVVAPIAWYAEATPAFASATSIDVASETGESRGDASCVPAGAVTIELTDRRLPTSGIACDEAKWRFGEGSSAEIRDASGVVVHARTGLLRPSVFRNLVLPAGGYTARVTYPGGETADRTFEVVVGQTTTVSVGER